jgi:hypothetical protein
MVHPKKLGPSYVSRINVGLSKLIVMTEPDFQGECAQLMNEVSSVFDTLHRWVKGFARVCEGFTKLR